MYKFIIESKTKEKIWRKKTLLHKYPSNIWFGNGIHSLLSRTDVRGSADIIYRISLLCRSGIFIDVKNRLRRE